MSVDNNTAQKLIAYAEKYEHPQFLLNDPAQFMHAVKGVKNKEIMAFIASALSYGARSAFIKRLHFLLDCTMGVPYDWIISGEYRKHIPDDSACFYRLYSNHLMLSFFDTLRQMIYSHDSIGQFVRTTINPNAKLENGKFRAIAALEAICTYFADRESNKIIPKDTRSCCKRLCMFLRWMVRSNSPVDLGLWSDFIDQSTLLLPLDTHVVHEAIELGLLKSKTTSMAAAQRLTSTLSEIFPGDPTKADFALFGYGVNKSRKL